MSQLSFWGKGQGEVNGTDGECQLFSWLLSVVEIGDKLSHVSKTAKRGGSLRNQLDFNS